MKLLFDQNLSYKLCRLLADIFPDSEQVRIVGLDQADDRVIWRYARIGGFTIVSHDADFAEIVSVLGPPPKVVWLRCGNQPTHILAERLRSCAGVLEAFDSDDEAAIWEIY